MFPQNKRSQGLKVPVAPGTSILVCVNFYELVNNIIFASSHHPCTGGLVVGLVACGWSSLDFVHDELELHFTKDIDVIVENHHISLPMSFTKDNSEATSKGRMLKELLGLLTREFCMNYIIYDSL